MDKERVIELAKKFTSERYNECCELIDDFDDEYIEEAYSVDCGNPWLEDFQRYYIDHGYLAADFEVGDYDHMSSDKQLQLDIAITKSYIDYATKQEGTKATALCALIHDYFGKFLNKI